MNTLLIFFREDCLELWSIDTNNRLVPVLYNGTHEVPLYFLYDRVDEQIYIGGHAKEQYLRQSDGTYGDFWGQVVNSTEVYSRYGKSEELLTLLHFSLNESLIPEILKSHFHKASISSFFESGNLLVLYDSFINSRDASRITDGFLRVLACRPESFKVLNFWETYIRAKCISDPAFIFLNASLGNIFVDIIENKPPYHVERKVIIGKGRDPRHDIVLDFLATKIKARGSTKTVEAIKKLLEPEAPEILNKLSSGLVVHTIKNAELGTGSAVLKIQFSSAEILGRLNNQSALNRIKTEFDEFRGLNNASGLPIYFYGEVINQDSFTEFFSSTYKGFHPEVSLDLDRTLIESILTDINRNSTPTTPDKKPPTPPRPTGPPPIPPRPTPPPGPIPGPPPRPTTPPVPPIPPRPAVPSAPIPTPPPRAAVPPPPRPSVPPGHAAAPPPPITPPPPPRPPVPGKNVPPPPITPPPPPVPPAKKTPPPPPKKK